LSPQARGYTFHVPGGGITTAHELLGAIAREAGHGSRITTVSAPGIFWLAGLFSPLIREVKEMLYLKKERFILSGASYAATFGPYPVTPYPEGVRKSLQWAREFYKES
jgi:hypothetical protein